jgi:hypothetical protein
MTCIDSARTTQVLERAFDILDAGLAGHWDRENSFEGRDRHRGGRLVLKSQYWWFRRMNLLLRTSKLLLLSRFEIRLRQRLPRLTIAARSGT